MLDFLKGKKTYILMALAILSALLSFATNQIDVATCIATIITATGVGSLRMDLIPQLSFLAKYRTYFLMAGGIIVAVVSFANGDLSLVGMITAIIAALGLGSFSAGIKKFIK